jgi:hypothetical protein
MVTKVEPHEACSVYSPDEIAETIDGVSDVPGLYEALWALVRHYDGKPRSEVNDDFADRAVCNWWDELSVEHQVEINRLLTENDWTEEEEK